EDPEAELFDLFEPFEEGETLSSPQEEIDHEPCLQNSDSPKSAKGTKGALPLIPHPSCSLRLSPSIGWVTVKNRVNLVSVTSALLGHPVKRKGSQASRLWWLCPFHDDRNPSFCIVPGTSRWQCFGCGEKGDAAKLVMS